MSVSVRRRSRLNQAFFFLDLNGARSQGRGIQAYPCRDHARPTREASYGVQVERLFLRGEGVEQRETGLAFDVLVVPLEQEFDRDGDLCSRLGQDGSPHVGHVDDGLRELP